MTDMAHEISVRLPKLKGYARYLTRNETDADDLLQDCMERAIDRQAQFKPDTNLDAWLKVVMKNIFLNGKRRDKLMRNHVERESQSESLFVPPSQEDHMELQDVISAMDELSDDHRNAIQLICISQVGYQEAANKMHVPMSTAKTRLFRARERLRTQIAA